MDGQIHAEFRNELFRACAILFGEHIDVSRDFLYYIQPSGVKSAYRRRALETHPDTASLRAEEDGGPGASTFIETNWAYNHLLDFIRHRDNGHARPYTMSSNRVRPKQRPRRHAHASQEHTGHQRHHRGSYYKGKLPSRKLLFGQFLFYSGAVSWEALIKAIVWQRNQRPRIGELAKRWGWVSQEDIRKAIRSRELGEPLGEAMIRLNLLSRAQLSTVLASQRTLQKPFGEYFIENSMITKARLNQLAKDFRLHNTAHKKGFNSYCRV